MRRLGLAGASLGRQAAAEFRKIAAARATLAFLVALPVGTYLVAFELYHVERAGDRMGVPDLAPAVPLLFFASWKTLLFRAAVVAFAAFWTTLDGLAQWTALARFAIEALVFSLALAWVGTAAASFRRTVGSGIVVAVMAVVVLALMTMLPFDLVPPRLVFMRYFFFPLGELPNPWPGHHDSPFVRVHTLAEFWTVVPATPLLLSVAALLHFRRRDITE